MKQHDSDMPSGELIMWRLEKLEEGQTEHGKCLTDLKAGVGRIEQHLAAAPSCPSASTCSGLPARVERLESKMQSVEDAKLKAETWISAGTWFGKIVYALAAAGVLQFAVNLWNAFNK